MTRFIMLILKVHAKLIWWIFIRPVIIITLLLLYVVYGFCRLSMTMLLKIWYPNTRFGDLGFNDSSYHKYEMRRKDDLYK
jgi:hypothetical protein